jgi:hypothetical protein
VDTKEAAKVDIRSCPSLGAVSFNNQTSGVSNVHLGTPKGRHLRFLIYSPRWTLGIDLPLSILSTLEAFWKLFGFVHLVYLPEHYRNL